MLKSDQTTFNFVEHHHSSSFNSNKSRSSRDTLNLENSIDRDILVNENKYLKKRLADNLAELASKGETIMQLQFEIENLKKMQKYDNFKEFCSADKLMDLATFILSNFSNISSETTSFQQDKNVNDYENNDHNLFENQSEDNQSTLNESSDNFKENQLEDKALSVFQKLKEKVIL